MEERLFIKMGVAIPRREIWFTAAKSGGPGGQHVNKTSSKVTLHWEILQSQAFSSEQRERVVAKLKNRINADGILQIHCEDYRSQHRNRDQAVKRLVELVLGALFVPKRRIPTQKSKRTQLRRLEEKRKRSERKQSRRSILKDDY